MTGDKDSLRLYLYLCLIRAVEHHLRTPIVDDCFGTRAVRDDTAIPPYIYMHIMTHTYSGQDDYR